MEKKQSCSTCGDFLSLVILGFIYPRFCCRRLFRTRHPTPHPLCAAGSVQVHQHVPESRTWCWDSRHTALNATANFSQIHPKSGLAALSEAMAGTALLGICWLGVCVPCPMQGAVPRARWLRAVSAQPHATRPQPCALLCFTPPPAQPALLSPPGPPPSLLCQHGASHCAETPLEKPAGLLLAQCRQSWGAEGGPHPTPQHKTGVLGRDPQPHPGCTLGAWAGCGDAPSLLIWGWAGREARGC